MVREVVTVSCGQAEVQLGDVVWREYCADHGVSADGQRLNTSDKGLFRFFEERTEVFLGRNLSGDLEPNVIDVGRNSILSNLFNPEFLLNVKQVAKGHYTLGKEIIGKVNNRMRILADKCDNVGVLSLLERMATDYRKKSKLGFNVYQNQTDCLLDYNEVSLLFDIETIDNYGLCENSMNDLNAATLGFKSEISGDSNAFENNVISFPRLHFVTTFMAPVLKAQTSVESITSSNFVLKLNDFDWKQDQFSDVKSKEATATAQWLKDYYNCNKKCTFVEWYPSGLGERAALPQGDDIDVFTDRVGEKYKLMYSKWSFFDWYIGEQMEGEFADVKATGDLEILEKDYLDILAKQSTDEEDGDGKIVCFNKYKQKDEPGVDNYMNGNNNNDDDTYKYEEISERFFTAMDDKDYIHDGNIDNRSTQTDDDAQSQRFEFDGWLIKEKNNNTSNEIINMTMSMEEDQKLDKALDGVAWSDPSCNSNTFNSNSGSSSSSSTSSSSGGGSSTSSSSGSSSSLSTANSSSDSSSWKRMKMRMKMMIRTRIVLNPIAIIILIQ